MAENSLRLHKVWAVWSEDGTELLTVEIEGKEAKRFAEETEEVCHLAEYSLNSSQEVDYSDCSPEFEVVEKPWSLDDIYKAAKDCTGEQFPDIWEYRGRQHLSGNCKKCKLN